MILILHPTIHRADEVREFFAGVGDAEIVGLSQGVECIHNREDEVLVAALSMIKARDNVARDVNIGQDNDF